MTTDFDAPLRTQTIITDKVYWVSVSREQRAHNAKYVPDLADRNCFFQRDVGKKTYHIKGAHKGLLRKKSPSTKTRPERQRSQSCLWWCVHYYYFTPNKHPLPKTISSAVSKSCFLSKCFIHFSSGDTLNLPASRHKLIPSKKTLKTPILISVNLKQILHSDVRPFVLRP